MSEFDRRRFLYSTGTIATVGLAGCTSADDDPDSSNETIPSDDGGNTTDQSQEAENEDADDDWDAAEEFLEHYKETEIPGENTSLAERVDGRTNKSSINSGLDGNETTYEIVREAVPRYAQTIQFPRDQDAVEDGMNFIDAARHGIHNQYEIDPEEVFILERDAVGNATLGEAFLNTGTEEQPEWVKEVFLSPPSDAEDESDYYLIHGEVDKDSTENMVSGRRNLKGMYNPSTSNNISALDWRVLEPESEISDEAWENFSELNDTYLPAGIDEVGFTRDALELIAEQEDFYRENGHNETVEAMMEATGFYLNEVGEDHYMALDVEQGELTPVEIDEEVREGLIYDPDYPLT
ncbi:hypothetical protein [Natranaeroarchaeum sulfidigenes]|uniref:Uncharacterized protein n=1 Tax=Natranaeroarchaeum sulfidigenes TaxID=2784880 RepID=A0A897MZI2_9EURY|nr:hypothetical protein [Natranaeroarchaeum sulfidigenes]QSG04289.1 hypothetical protein AArcS_3102 [Natranaeroarchaeum sulfidigenes]